MPSNVWLTNNTPYSFSMNTPDPGISKGDWGIYNSSIGANADKVGVYWTNRDVGITPSEYFTFDTQIAHNSGTTSNVVVLQVQLLGTTTSSIMWIGCRGEAGSSQAFDSPWYTDAPNTNVEVVTWPQNNGWFTLSMNTFMQGGWSFSDVNFVLSYEANSSPTAAAAGDEARPRRKAKNR